MLQRTFHANLSRFTLIMFRLMNLEVEMRIFPEGQQVGRIQGERNKNKDEGSRTASINGRMGKDNDTKLLEADKLQ